MAFQNVHAPVQAPQKYTDKYSFIEDKTRRTYAGMVDIMDEAVGNITEAMKDAGYENLLFLQRYKYINNSPIWYQYMLGHLSANIICFEKRTVSQERSSRKTVSFEEQIMSRDKYARIFSCQIIGYCVYYPSNNFHNTSDFENWGISSAGEYSVT